MAESPDWEVLDLPPEVEIARKARKSDADLMQAAAVEKVSRPFELFCKAIRVY